MKKFAFYKKYIKYNNNNKLNNLNIKKNDLISIEFINILSDKLPIKKKKITGLCIKYKKSYTNPTINLKLLVLNEYINFIFSLKSPLILKIIKIK